MLQQPVPVAPARTQPPRHSFRSHLWGEGNKWSAKQASRGRAMCALPTCFPWPGDRVCQRERTQGWPQRCPAGPGILPWPATLGFNGHVGSNSHQGRREDFVPRTCRHRKDFLFGKGKRNLWFLHHRMPKGHEIFIVFNGSCIFKCGKTLLRGGSCRPGCAGLLPGGSEGVARMPILPGHLLSQACSSGQEPNWLL